jgi:hypothetical protein
LISTSDTDDLLNRVEKKRLRLERLLQMATHEYELRFDFGQRDSLGAGQIVLGIALEQIEKARFPNLKSRTLHLLGHYLADSLAWGEQARRIESQNMPHFVALWHALEDARIENELTARWPGLYRLFELKIPPNLGGSLFKMMSETRQLEMGLYLEGRGYRDVRYSDNVAKAIESVRKLIRRGAQGRSPQATIDAVKRIYPAVASLLRGEHLRGGAPPDGSTSLGEEDEDAGRTDGSAIPEIKIDQDDLVSVGVMGQRRDLPDWYRPGTTPWFEKGLGEKEIHPAAVCTDLQTIIEPGSGDRKTYREIQAEVRREAGFLIRRLTNVLQEDVYLKYSGYFHTGKLNMAKLWKQRLGAYRLFQRPEEGGLRSVVASLLIDESASMKNGDKIQIAMKTGILLGETLSQLDVPLEIIGFTTADYEARAAMKLGLVPAHEYRTTRCSPLEHRLYKRFDESFQAVCTRLTGIDARHNNWDEEHLLFAFRRLQARNARWKIIFIISDGQPNGDAAHLIKTVEMLERRQTTVIGIGIGQDFVRQIYKNAIVMTDFGQMAESMLEMLAHELRRKVSYPDKERIN